MFALLLLVAIASGLQIDCERISNSLAYRDMNIVANWTWYNTTGEVNVLFFDLKVTNDGNTAIELPITVELQFENNTKNYTIGAIKTTDSSLRTTHLDVNKTFVIKRNAMYYGIEMGNSTEGTLAVSIDNETCIVGVVNVPILQFPVIPVMIGAVVLALAYVVTINV